MKAGVYYFDDTGFQHVIVGEPGRKFIPIVRLTGSGLKLEKVPLDRARYIRDAKLHGRPYPVARAIRRMLRAGRELGMTKGAAAVLRALRAGT